MNKFAYLDGLVNIVSKRDGIPINTIQDTLAQIFPDASIRDDGGGLKFYVDFTPVDTIKIGFNDQLKRFMIWADNYSAAALARKHIYLEFEKRFPGLIEKVRKQWDVSAKEVRGL